MEIKIPKEVRDYHENIFFGLNTRQFICSVLAVGVAVGDVELLLGLLAGQNSLVAVDDDDEIAAVNIGGIIDLLLAAQQNSSLSSDVAQALAGSVEQIPLALDFSGLDESSAHIYFLLISVSTVQCTFWGASVSIHHKNAPVNIIFRFFRLSFFNLSFSHVFS